MNNLKAPLKRQIEIPLKYIKKNPFVCAQDGDQRTGYKPALHVVNVQSIFLLTHTGHRAVVHLFPNDPQAAL